VPANAPPFLWKVHRGDGPTLWLYGTLHDLGASDVPRSAWTALDGSPVFTSELGDLAPDPDKLADLVNIKDGPGLDSLLDADHWYALRDTLAGSIKEDALKRVQPWYALTLLTKKAAPPPKPEMDVALAEHASSNKLRVDHLEQWDEQLAALKDSITPADLAGAIDQVRTMSCQIARIKTAYASGDVVAMGQLLGAEQSARLLTARNQVWLPKLEAYLASGGAFVAVGVSHMAGDSGLPALFEKAGYTVERQRN
jgi:uncharacterized protein YbaP (TraB family)